MTIVSPFAVLSEDIPIATDTASDSASLINVVNNNSNGDDFNQVIIDIVDENNQDINVGDFQPETTLMDEEISTASNEADINNSLILLVATDEAEINANIFNLVNVNLVGDNWFFNIVNLFQPQNGDIILPYEFTYLKNEDGSTLSSNSYVVNNFNQADVSSNVTIEGNINNVAVNILDVVNTNIVGDRWLFLQINNFAQWDGQLKGWWGNYYQDRQRFFAWGQLNDGNNFQENGGLITIKNSNVAHVENNILISSNSNNQANIKANIFDFINTNIVGNNWYFSTINIFDNFVGDVVFPRPDLLVSITADKNEVLPGDEITYHLYYKNQGNLSASESLITTNLPLFTSLVDGQISWKLTEIKPGGEGNVYFTLKIDADYPNNKIVNTALIATTTFELNKDNNTSTNIVSVKKESNKIDAVENIEMTPTATPAIIISPLQPNQSIVLGSTSIKTPTKKLTKNVPLKKKNYLSYLILFPGIFFLVLGFLIRRNRGDRWWI